MICFHSTAIAADLDQEDPPRFIMFLGRFHPVLLHLPIGAFLITFFLDIMGRIRKDYPRTAIVYGLGFSAFFGVLLRFIVCTGVVGFSTAVGWYGMS